MNRYKLHIPRIPLPLPIVGAKWKLKRRPILVSESVELTPLIIVEVWDDHVEYSSPNAQTMINGKLRVLGIMDYLWLWEHYEPI